MPYWIHERNRKPYCSYCGASCLGKEDIPEITSPYCPYCGAPMDNGTIFHEIKNKRFDFSKVLINNPEPPTDRQRKFVKEIFRFIDASRPEVESKECYYQWISRHIEEYKKKKTEGICRLNEIRLDKEIARHNGRSDDDAGFWDPDSAHDNPGLAWGMTPEDFGVPSPWGDS